MNKNSIPGGKQLSSSSNNNPKTGTKTQPLSSPTKQSFNLQNQISIVTNANVSDVNTDLVAMATQKHKNTLDWIKKAHQQDYLFKFLDENINLTSAFSKTINTQKQKKVKEIKSIDILKKSHIDLTIQCARLSREENKWKTEKTDLIKKADEYKALYDNISSLLNEKQTKIKESQLNEKQSRQQIKQLTLRIKQLTQNNKSTTQQKDKSKNIIQNLTQQLKKSRNKISVYQQKIQSLRKTYVTGTQLLTKFNKNKISSQSFNKQQQYIFTDIIKDLQTKIQQEKQLDRLSALYTQQNKFITEVKIFVSNTFSNWSQQKTVKDRQIIQLQTKIKNANIQINNIKESAQKIQTDFKNQIKQLNKDLKIKQNECITKERSIITIKQNASRQKQQMDDVHTVLEGKLKDLQKKLQIKQKLIKDLQAKNAQASQSNQSIAQQNNNKINQLKDKVSQTQKQRDDLKQKQFKLKQQLRAQQNKFKQQRDNQLNQQARLNKQKSQLSIQLTRLRSQYQSEKSQKDKVILKEKSTQRQLNQSLQNIKKIQDKLKQYQKKASDLKSCIFTYQEDLNQKQRQINELNNIPRFQRCYTQYFNGNILNFNRKKDQEWLVNSLQNLTQRQIKWTRPLYRFDLANQTSFHAYIDNQPNIALIIRMGNGQTIACYSAPAIKPQTKVDYEEGYMFSFKNQKTFRVKKCPSSAANKTNPKPITYDEYFIIWGNSDIRIKSGTKELYSNYSTGNCSYEQTEKNPNPTVNDLFNQPERDAIVEDFEFFQIEFEDQDRRFY